MHSAPFFFLSSLAPSCYPDHSTEVHTHVTHYTGTAPCFLHTVREEVRNPRTPGLT